MEKICNKCGLIKPINEFEKRKDSKDGHRQYCRLCKNERQNERNKERKLIDESYFWDDRSRSFNKHSGRNGVAKKIIKESTPIKSNELKNLYYNNNCRCSYCDVNLKKENIVFDHLTPLSRGGQHKIENITCCCKDCNNLKWGKTEKEFREFLSEYVLRFLNTLIPC